LEIEDTLHKSQVVSQSGSDKWSVVGRQIQNRER